MVGLLNRVLQYGYSRVPPSLRPRMKRAAIASMLRAQSLAKRRRVERGCRIEFLDFEIAHLEPYRFMGAGGQDALVRTHASCVSPGTERAVLCGLPGARRSFPYVPGYSAAGVVLRASGSNRFRPGDRVAGRMPHASAGLMSPSSMFHIPAGVSDEDAAMIELGIICLQGVRKAFVRPGERLAVIGQGLIGQLAARLARVSGARDITGVAASRRRAEPALRNRVVDAFIALSDDATAVQTIQADVVIEAVGSTAGITLAMQAARPSGRVVLLGSARDIARNLDWATLAQARNLTVIGAHISAMPRHDPSPAAWTYQQEGRLFLDLLARGVLRVNDLITWRPMPGDCNRVYESLAAGGAEHVAIVYDWRSGGGDTHGTSTSRAVGLA